MVVVIDSSVPRRVARFQPVWRKCMTTTIRPVSTIALIGLSETNTIGYIMPPKHAAAQRTFGMQWLLLQIVCGHWLVPCDSDSGNMHGLEPVQTRSDGDDPNPYPAAPLHCASG